MQRTEARLPAVIPLRIMRGKRASLVRTVDVSRHALFLETEETFPERSLVHLKFDACGEEIDAWAFIVRTGVCRGVRGVAVRFYARSDLMKRLWDRFLIELERAYERKPSEGWLLRGREQYAAV